MARILVTGSAGGLGKLSARMLISEGHRVMLHARSMKRGESALAELQGAEALLTADLSSMEETKRMASEANASGIFDAVIHNAGVYRVPNTETFAVNSVAPYILTCLMQRPARLIYLSSGLHMQGSSEMSFKTYRDGMFNYSDTKLHMVLLAKIISRLWKGVYANAVNPGWVPTRMGGSSAPDDLQKGAETQAWLAVSNDPKALVSGKYFFHKNERQYSALADDQKLQEDYLTLCEKITGISFPRS